MHGSITPPRTQNSVWKNIKFPQITIYTVRCYSNTNHNTHVLSLGVICFGITLTNITLLVHYPLSQATSFLVATACCAGTPFVAICYTNLHCPVFPTLNMCCLLSHYSYHFLEAVSPYYSPGYLPLNILIPNFSKSGTQNKKCSPFSDSWYCVQNIFQSGKSYYHKISVSH